MGGKLADKVLGMVRKEGMIHSRELTKAGISRVYLYRLREQKVVRRVARGLYVAQEADPTEHHTLAEACLLHPRGVLCLLSALQFYHLTTQAPFEVWMAIESKAWKPKTKRPAMRFVRFGGRAFTEGVEAHQVEGVKLKVYRPAKTIADCFKYRNKIGLEVALEALRDGKRQRKCTNDELWYYAKICRVAQVMKPYLEAMG